MLFAMNDLSQLNLICGFGIQTNELHMNVKKEARLNLKNSQIGFNRSLCRADVNGLTRFCASTRKIQSKHLQVESSKCCSIFSRSPNADIERLGITYKRKEYLQVKIHKSAFIFFTICQC